jgi:hypothetical protein
MYSTLSDFTRDRCHLLNFLRIKHANIVAALKLWRQVLLELKQPTFSAGS